MWEISLWALLAVVITVFVVCSIFALSALFGRPVDGPDTGTEAPLSNDRVLYLLSRERNEKGRF